MDKSVQINQIIYEMLLDFVTLVMFRSARIYALLLVIDVLTLEHITSLG